MKNASPATARETDNGNLPSVSSNAAGAKARRAFTPIELVLLLAAVLFFASLLFAFLSSSWRDARDEKRIEDIRRISLALKEYYRDHRSFPRESDGANGNLEENKTLQALLAPYLSELPRDPAGPDSRTYFYYYDGAHRCGDNLYAAVFARQMDNAKHANYKAVAEDLCDGILDDEGRGGVIESYTIILGPSSESR